MQLITITHSSPVLLRPALHACYMYAVAADVTHFWLSAARLGGS